MYFLTKLSKIADLYKICIFHRKFPYLTKLWFLTKIVIFDENFDIWQKFAIFY